MVSWYFCGINLKWGKRKKNPKNMLSKPTKIKQMDNLIFLWCENNSTWMATFCFTSFLSGVPSFPSGPAMTTIHMCINVLTLAHCSCIASQGLMSTSTFNCLSASRYHCPQFTNWWYILKQECQLLGFMFFIYYYILTTTTCMSKVHCLLVHVQLLY